jgi:hypothetical protein
MPTIVPAISPAEAYILAPGASTLIIGRVVAWVVGDVPSAYTAPVTVPAVINARVAVRFTDGPTLIECPARMHANPEEFRISK